MEERKGGIVKTLMGMNSYMRIFSRDIESRLDKVYTKGAGKKYGYDDITNQSMASVSMGGSSESKYEDRRLNKIQTQAQTFLDSSSSLNMSAI